MIQNSLIIPEFSRSFPSSENLLSIPDFPGMWSNALVSVHWYKLNDCFNELQLKLSKSHTGGI